MTQEDFRDILRIALLSGLVAASASAIGMVRAFDERDLIVGVLSVGQLLLFSAPAVAGYVAAGEHETIERASALVSGLLAGVLTSVPVLILILIGTVFPSIRDFSGGEYGLINVTPALIEILTFEQGVLTGSLLLAAVMGAVGLISALVYILPRTLGRPIIMAVLWTLSLTLLSEVLQEILRSIFGVAGLRAIFGTAGMRPLPALVLFVMIALVYLWWQGPGRDQLQERLHTAHPLQQRRVRLIAFIVLFVLVLLAPLILGRRLSDVVNSVGLFVLMGLGLNIVVGFAGLLDLGYVAFFAIGAYSVGILTSAGPLGIFNLSFWAALPIAILAATLAGVLLGTPVLRMRGDYLAIVTLGFGEIIRVLATSDLLKPYIGGGQGILQIPRPFVAAPGAVELQIIQPQQFYYLILAGILLAAFVSWRLRDARLGRQWMAMREDEDVAEAMGIHLVKTKLLAFAIGAAFSGLAGAIQAARIGSIFPHSFSLLISINVLSLIIVGGIGSLPGVLVGALFLVGLPELLREFESYRLLMYGALLIAMMVAKPEGLWPSPVRRRELHKDEYEDAFPSDVAENPFTDEPMAEQVVESPNTATK